MLCLQVAHLYTRKSENEKLIESTAEMEVEQLRMSLYPIYFTRNLEFNKFYPLDTDTDLSLPLSSSCQPQNKGTKHQ